MPYKQFTFTAASGATSTNKMYVGHHTNFTVVLSSITSFNAAAGNMSVTVRGGLSESDTHADINISSANILTQTTKGIYPMGYLGTPYMSLGFGTAITGTAANTIDVVVYADPSGN